MLWPFIHYPAGSAPSRECAVRAPSLDAARAKLARALDVPPGRFVRSARADPAGGGAAGWRVTHYPAGRRPFARVRGAGAEPGGGEANPRRRLGVPVWTLR